jgi:uncharacterized membrane protein
MQVSDHAPLGRRRIRTADLNRLRNLLPLSELREYEAIAPGTLRRLLDVEREIAQVQRIERSRAMLMIMAFAMLGAIANVVLSMWLFLKDINVGGSVFAIGAVVTILSGLIVAWHAAVDKDLTERDDRLDIEPQ